MATSHLPTPNRRTKGPRYVPVARRGDKPDAIMWLVKHHSELKDTQIIKLIGTTKETITKIRERTVTMDCDTFAATVNLTHIDFLSLDVEQHEAAVLRGVDWDRVTIDIIIMEGDWATTGKMLTEERGYRRVDYLGAPNVGQSAYLRPGFKLAIEEAGGEIMKAVPPSHDI